ESHLIVARLTKLPAYGHVTVHADGSFIYVPDPFHFEGIDTFGYVASDGISESRSALVQIKLTSGLPVGGHDTYLIPKDWNHYYGLFDLLNNDWDPDGRPLELVNVAGGPMHGSISFVEPDAPVAYFPEPGFEGFDSFTYTVTNGVTESAPI